MPTETTVLHSSEETTPITDNLKKKLQEEFEVAQKDLAKAEAKAHDLADSEDAEAKGKALEDLEKAKAKVEDLKSKMIAAGMNPDEGTPTPVVPGVGVEPVQPHTEDGTHEATPVVPTPAVPSGSEEGHGTTETHETGTPGSSETHTPAGDHLEETHTETEPPKPPAAHAEEGTHEETHEAKPSADEAALKAKAEAAKAEVETAKTDLEKAQAKVEELAKDEHASEEDKAKAAKALVDAKAKLEETTKEAAKAEAAANPANKLGGVAYALASGAYRML